MKINDIANAITEKIIFDKKDRQYIIDDVRIDFKFTSKSKYPFTNSKHPGKTYNGQYGMMYTHNCNPDEALDVCYKFVEKVRNDIGYDIAFPCKNYYSYSSFGYVFQVIFGKEIKEGE